MAVLPVNHPDIFDFVSCKENEGEIEHFNISVGITDKFMEAVKNNRDFPLIDPHSQEVVKKIKAKKLFDKIAGVLEPDGYLIIGASESLLGINSRFQPHRHLRSIFYQMTA